MLRERVINDVSSYSLRTCSVPGTVLNGLCGLSHLIFTEPFREGTHIIPILQIKKLPSEEKVSSLLYGEVRMQSHIKKELFPNEYFLGWQFSLRVLSFPE